MMRVPEDKVPIAIPRNAATTDPGKGYVRLWSQQSFGTPLGTGRNVPNSANEADWPVSPLSGDRQTNRSSPLGGRIAVTESFTVRRRNLPGIQT